jgi:hypothetical protein
VCKEPYGISDSGLSLPDGVGIKIADGDSTFYNGGQDHRFGPLLSRVISGDGYCLRIWEVVGLETEDLVLMHVSIHEDNARALVLVKTIPPEFTPRSKYYAVKTVWFREEIQKRGIKLLKIETVEQLGDIFTKGLAKATFEYLRKKMIWDGDWLGLHLSLRGSVVICEFSLQK